jgi:hypothetical protein
MKASLRGRLTFGKQAVLWIVSLLYIFVLGMCDATAMSSPAMLADENADVRLKVEHAPELQDLFEPRGGADKRQFTGGDVAFSIRLNATRTLWIFGDTLVGRVADDGSRDLVPEPIFPRNSIAVIDGEFSAQPPRASDVAFTWRTNASGEPDSFFTPPLYNRFSNYLWMYSAVLVRAQLFVFGTRMTNRTGATGFDFSCLASTVIRVENPLDAPMKWRMTYSELPPAGGRRPDDLYFGVATKLVTAAQVSSSPSSSSNFVYLLGTETKALNSDDSIGGYHGRFGGVLSRISVDALLAADYSRIDFLTNTGGVHSFHRGLTAADKLVAIFPNGGETTFEWVPSIKRWVSLCAPFMGTRLLLRTAPTLEGPWTQQVAYTLPPQFTPAEDAFAYAVKTHPELATSDSEIIVTFMSNMKDLKKMLQPGHLDVYTPQFLRIFVVPSAEASDNNGETALHK